jgi:hypothetical protein
LYNAHGGLARIFDPHQGMVPPFDVSVLEHFGFQPILQEIGNGRRGWQTGREE